MKDLAGTTAATERFEAAYRIVWLLEIDADAPDVATTVVRYGSRKYTLGAVTYTDELAAGGLELGWNKVRVGGGLAQVASMRFRVRNEDQESDNMDTFFLENDEVRAYLVFVTGSETASDKILVQQGVVEDLPFTVRTWDFDVIDGSDKDFSTMPKQRVDLVTHPYAPLGAYGKPIPVAFGALNVTPDDDAGSRAAMAPCRCLDAFSFEFTSGEVNDVYGQPYQFYQRAGRYAKISNWATLTSGARAGSSFYIEDAERVMRLLPVLPASGNDRTSWFDAADGDDSTSVAVASGQNLDVWIGGTPKLGTIQSALVQINGTGTYSYDILYNGSSIFNGTDSNDTTIALTDAATDHADDWDFELYEVRIGGSSPFDGVIEQIYLAITYDDQLTQERSELSIFQAITGWEDRTTYLQDGSVISSDGAAMESSAHVLAALLRGKQTMQLQSASVNLTAVAAAHTDRSDWKPALSMDTEVNIEFLQEFGLQFAMHIFKDFEGRWKMVAQEKLTEPVHTFLTNLNIAVRNPDASPAEWEPDLSFSRTSVRDLINEVALRYGLDRGTGEYTKLKVASGRYRLTATDGVLTQGSPSDTGTLTSASSTFQTDGMVEGDTVYVKGDKEYTVSAAPASETAVAISASTGDVNAASGKTFWAGPNLSGEMVRSQNRYKTENALGRKAESFVDIGGYPSDFIQDDTTADNFITHIEEWRSQRRVLVEFATFLNAVDVELGDFCWFDHTWLPPSKRPVTIGTITAGINATVTVANSAENVLLRVDDHVCMDSEVLKVTAVDYSGTSFNFTRANSNTQAAAHSSGATIKRLDLVRWEVVGHRYDIALAQIRLQLQETPPAYQPTGVVVETGYPDWDTATAEQRTASGWSTLISGRVKDDDEYSAVSWVGPDTSTY